MCLIIAAGIAGSAGLYAVKVRGDAGERRGTLQRVRAETRKTGVGRWVMVDTGTILGNLDIVSTSAFGFCTNWAENPTYSTPPKAS
jgi:hypothetical protein